MALEFVDKVPDKIPDWWWRKKYQKDWLQSAPARYRRNKAEENELV